MQERQRAESRQVDPVRSRCEIGDGVELGRVGIVRGKIDKGVITFAAGQLVTAISANDGIVAAVAVDGVAAGSSVDRVVAPVALNRIVA